MAQSAPPPDEYRPEGLCVLLWPGPQKRHVEHVCHSCYVRHKYNLAPYGGSLAIYQEQTDYSMRPVKTCPMCGKSRDASIGTFCSSCAGAMYRPSFKERKRMAPLWDEYMRNESEREQTGREGVNSVGALQVLPEPALPVWPYRIHPSGTQPDGTVTWSSHVEYIPPNPLYKYKRNAKKGSFKIHGFK